MKTYTRGDIRQAFQKVGVGKGDTVFIHANLGFFGRLEGAKRGEEYAEAFFSELKELVGPGGNICVPTFTYSFCNNQPFNRLTTSSKMGIFAEYVRTLPEAVRSEDANFSVSVWGPGAVDLTENAPSHSFGNDSFWERLLKADGKILNLNFDAASTFVHYVEKKLGVPYRYDKGFTGHSLIGGEWEDRTYYHFVRHLNKPEWDTSLLRFDRLARERGIVSFAYLCRGSILALTAKDTYRVIEEAVKSNPYYLTVGQEDLGL